MNTGFGPNPVLFNTFPYSTLGAGLIVLPTESVQFTFTAASPGGPPIAPASTTCSQEGVVLDAELRVGIKPFGLPGHQLIGGIWSTQTFTSLTQDLAHVDPDRQHHPRGDPTPRRPQRGPDQQRRRAPGPSTITSISSCIRRRRTARKASASSAGLALPIGTPTFSSSSTASASPVRACSPGGIRTALASASTTPTSATTCRSIILSGDEIGLEIFYNIAATNWLYRDAGYPGHRTGRQTRHHRVPDRAASADEASSRHNPFGKGWRQFPRIMALGANRSRNSRELNRRSAPVFSGCRDRRYPEMFSDVCGAGSFIAIITWRRT